MVEAVPCPCTIYEPHRQTSTEVALNWNGEPNVVRSVGIPAHLHPNQAVSVPGITLGPQSDPIKLTVEATEDLIVTWPEAEPSGGGAVLVPDPRRPTQWAATYRLGDLVIPRPRPVHVRLTLARRTVSKWFVSAMTGVSGVAGLICLGSVILVVAGGGMWAAFVALLGGATAALAYPTAFRLLSRRYGFALPSDEVPVGSIPLPPIELVPTIRRSEAIEHPLVAEYCSRTARETSRLEILGLASPINLEDGYVPILLRMHRGGDAQVSVLPHSYSQVDELIRADLDLMHLLRGESLTPEEAWQRHPRLTIIGEVGAGKTTILQRLAISLGCGPVLWTVAVPVIIELHRFAHRPGLEDQPVESVKDAISEELAGMRSSAEGREEARALVDRLVETGELTLFLDGLDEVSGPGEEGERLLSAVLRAIAAVGETWPKVRLLVTCRRASMDRYRQLPDQFVVAETSPFDADGIHHFVRRYFAGAPERAAQLLDELERNPRLRAMAATPLLLALLTLIFEQRGSLPGRRTEIYRRCADLLLREWDVQRARERFPRFLLEHKEELLRRIAWDLHVRGLRYVAKTDLIRLLETALPSVGLGPETAEDVLDEIAAHHGLIRTHDGLWFGFIHFALQEYFVAESVEHRAPLTVAVQHRHQAWWQEIIRLYAGRGDCTSLILALMKEPEDLFRTNVRLAADCLAQGTAVEPELRAEVLSEFLRVAETLRVPELDERLWCVLTQVGGAELAHRLWDAIADETLRLDVRTAIVKAMPGALGESFVEAALARLTDRKVPVEVRIALAEALCSPGAAAAHDALIRLLADPTADEELRAALARDACRRGLPDLVPVLRALVMDPAVPTEVRRQCAAALRILGVSDAVSRLCEMLVDWRIEPPVRSSLAAAIGDLADQSQLPEIIRVLSDPRVLFSVRTSLALSLKHLKSPALTDALLSLLREHKTDYGVRLAIADSLCSVATDVHRSALRALYSERLTEEPIRIRLAVALGTLGENDVAPILVRLLEDRTARPHLRLEAARTLGVLTDRSVAGAMIGVLDSRSVDPLGQELAVLVLSIRNEPATMLPLVHRLSDRQLPLAARLRMADALGALGAQDQVDRLVSLLPDRSVTAALRGRIALAIMRITDARNTRAFERLVRILPSTADVPEVKTLVWHLSEQVGTAVYPSDVGAPPIIYPWLQRWMLYEKDSAGDVEKTVQ